MDEADDGIEQAGAGEGPRQRVQDARPGLEGSRAAGGLRAVRDLPRDHRRPQGPLGAVVRRLDRRIVEEPHQGPFVVASAQAVEQALVVRVGEFPIPQAPGDVELRPTHPRVVVLDRGPGSPFMPQIQRVLQEVFQFRSESARRAGLPVDHLGDRPEHMGQADLPLDRRERRARASRS